MKASINCISLCVISVFISEISTPALCQENCKDDIYEQDLIVEHPRAKDIRNHHDKYCSDRASLKHFNGTVLGYVTPWNNHGYDVAKWFGNKFSYISPVWLQLKRESRRKYTITGTHDIDSNWIDAVRKNKAVKVVPRLLFDDWSLADFDSLHDPVERNALATEVINLAKREKFDGFVVEVWMQLLTSGGGGLRLAVQFVKKFSTLVRDANLDFILVVPPQRDGLQEVFVQEHFDYLSQSVTAFSLMTYDYSSAQKPGPNGPLKWIRQCVEHLCPYADDSRRSQILLGLNFYGYDYTPNGARSVLGPEIVEMLKTHKGKLKLDKDSAENFFEVKTRSGRHTVFYPTLYSIFKRIELAKELNVGVSIWELGQGMDYFYQLL